MTRLAKDAQALLRCVVLRQVVMRSTINFESLGLFWTTDKRCEKIKSNHIHKSKHADIEKDLICSFIHSGHDKGYVMQAEEYV